MPKFGQFKFGLEDFGSYTTTTTVDRNRVLGDTFYSDRDVVQLPAGKRSIVLASSITGEEDANKQAIITALQSIGGILKKGINVTTQAVKDALKEVIASYELKFYIQDDNGNWIDFTDRAEAHGRNQLRKLGSVSYSAERLRGELQQKLGSLTLDNTDNFWDKPFPTLQSTYNEAWKPYITNASFSSSYNSKETSIYRNKAAVRANVRLRGQEVEESLIMGVFLVDDVATDHKSRAATLKFVPISQVLTEDKLQNFKDGKTYYEHRDIVFLLKEILKRTLADSNGDIPSTFDIDNIQAIVPAEERRDGWTTSLLGPAPTYVNDGSSTVYTKDLRDIGAVESWYYDTGTISVTKGSNVVTGSSTGWKAVGSGGATQNNTIRVGDCFAIAKEFYDPHSTLSSGTDGGSQVGGSGYYEVLAIDDTDQTITLDRAPDVSADVSSINYSVVRVYIGKGSDLYEYNPATAVYRRLTTSSSVIGGSSLNYNIVRLFTNDQDTGYLLYGLSATAPSESRSTHYSRTARIFRFRWDGNTPDIDVDSNNPIYNLDLADYNWRENDYHNVNHTLTRYGSVIGNYHNLNSDHDFAGAPRAQHVPIPFKQTVRNMRTDTGVNITADARAEDFTEGYPAGAKPYSDNWADTKGVRYVFTNRRVEVPTGHYGFRFGPATYTGPWPYTIRSQTGNTGFCKFYRDHGNKGCILYAKKVKPTYSSNDRDEDIGSGTPANGTAKYWEYTYHYYDIDHFDASGSSTSPNTDMSGIDTLNASSGHHGSLKNFIPTAIDIKVDPSNEANDRVYISFVRFCINDYRLNNRGDTDTGTNVNTVVYEFENFTDSGRTARQLYNLGETYDQTADSWKQIGGSNSYNQIPLFSIPFPTEIKYVQHVYSGSAMPKLYISSVDLNTLYGTRVDDAYVIKRPFEYQLGWLNVNNTVSGSTSPTLYSVEKDSAPYQGLASLPFSFEDGSSYRSTNTLFYHKTSSNSFEMVKVNMGGSYGSTSQDNKSFIAETSSQKSFVFGMPAVIPKLMEIYWISTSSQSQVDQPTTADLLRLSGVEQVNIELAQLESMTAWQAIGLLAEVGNAVYGFRPDGNLFFKRRIKAETPTYTFTSVGDSSILSLQKARGQNLIANHISKFPRMVKRGELDFKVEIGADSTYGQDDYAHEIDLRQRDDAAKSITLVCSESGNIRKSPDSSGNPDPAGAEFKYRINEPVFSTSLTVNYTTSSYVLSVDSTTDISYGSYVKVIGRDAADNEIRKEGRVGLPILYSGNQLLVETAVTENVDRIDTKTAATTSPTLSTTAVTNAGRALKANDLLLITDTTGTSYEYIRIIGIDSSTLIVQRNAFGFNKARSHAVGEKIYLISSLSELFLSAALTTNGADTFVVNDAVEVRPVFNDIDSTAFTDDPLADTQSSHTTASHIKPVNNVWTTIGGSDTAYSSHVQIKFSFAEDDDTLENNKPNEGLAFAVGDRVEITCKGISLEQDAASVHVEQDANSILRWGKRESSRQSNPLFSRYQARRAAKRELTEFAHPRWVFKVSTPITPWISLLDVVDLQFEEMLPKSKQFKETCYINNITYDLQSSGLATLTLVSVDPY